MHTPTLQDFIDQIARIFGISKSLLDNLESGCTLSTLLSGIKDIEYSCMNCRELAVVHSKLLGKPITIKGEPDRRSRKSGE